MSMGRWFIYDRLRNAQQGIFVFLWRFKVSKELMVVTNLSWVLFCSCTFLCEGPKNQDRGVDRSVKSEQIWKEPRIADGRSTNFGQREGPTIWVERYGRHMHV